MRSIVGVSWQRDRRVWCALDLVVIPMLGFSGFLGWRYREMKRRLAELENARPVTAVIHNHIPIGSDPPDFGAVNEIRTMTQAEYDSLPAKKETTLYLISNRKNGQAMIVVSSVQ